MFPSDVSPTAPTSLRCILIMGGHAAGKTMLVRWGQARIGVHPVFGTTLDEMERAKGYRWHTEGGNGGRASLSTMPVEEAVALAAKEWRDPAIHTMVVEGTRVYGSIFKVARDHYAVGRALWVLQLLQTPDVMRAHLRARCTAKGKEYRADYWDDQEYQATYQGADRHIAALRKFLPRSRGPNVPPNAWDPPLGERLTIWVEPGHTNLGPAYTWFANALRVPIVRTPVHVEEPRPVVRTPVRLPEEVAR